MILKGQSQGHSHFRVVAVYYNLYLDVTKESFVGGQVFRCPSGLSCSKRFSLYFPYIIWVGLTVPCSPASPRLAHLYPLWGIFHLTAQFNQRSHNVLVGKRTQSQINLFISFSFIKNIYYPFALKIKGPIL